MWRKHNVKRAVGPKRATLLHRKASKSGLTEGATAARHELAMYLEQYAMLCRQIDQLMVLVEESVKQIPGAQEMMSIPCIGMITVAGFLAQVGNLFDYRYSQQIVRHAGLSLREDCSGKRKGETTTAREDAVDCGPCFTARRWSWSRRIRNSAHCIFTSRLAGIIR